MVGCFSHNDRVGEKMSSIKEWMTLATVEEQKTLAKLMGTSRGYLYQLSSGERHPKVEFVARLEWATQVMHSEENDLLPVLSRGLVHHTCRACKYYVGCQIKLLKKD